MSPSLRNQNLDLIRGVSILLVLVGHSSLKTLKFNPLLFPFLDAALGVRIFFVLSGFIITSLLIQEKSSTQSIDWKAFLLKRFSKLIPSLLVLIVIVQLLNHMRSFGCSARDYWASLFFISEVVGIHCWPLGHTWSLSVEELFYLTWLPCMICFQNKSVIRLLWGVIGLAPLVRAYNHLRLSHPDWFSQIPHPPIYWLPHLDLIAWGALAAFYFPSFLEKWDTTFVEKRAKRLSWLLVLLLLVSAIPLSEITFSKIYNYITIPFLFSVQGALVALLICFLVGKKQILRRPNKLRQFLAYLGAVSYSVYLFQQVVIPNPFLASTQNEWTLGTSILYFCLAVGAGILNYELIERPCLMFLRKKGKIPSSELIFRQSGSNDR